MACMEHLCTNMKCNYGEFNNSPSSPSYCPKCDSLMNHFWDETPDYDDGDFEDFYDDDGSDSDEDSEDSHPM